MPRRLILAGDWWRVRYERRALTIRVTFGSRQTQRLVLQAEEVLASIRR